MPLDDFLGNGKPNASAWIFRLEVEALKDCKDAILILWINPYAVVSNRKQPFMLIFFRRDVDLWWLLAAKFNAIGNKVLKEL